MSATKSDARKQKQIKGHAAKIRLGARELLKRRERELKMRIEAMRTAMAADAAAEGGGCPIGLPGPGSGHFSSAGTGTPLLTGSRSPAKTPTQDQPYQV